MNSLVGICVLVIIGSAMAFPQTSFYASNRNRSPSYPQVLPRFGGSDDNTNIANRLGDNDENATTTTSSNPLDGVHDASEVNRVASWPKDRQPFWYLNQQHISSQRGQQVPCTNCVNPQSASQPMPQSPFAPRS